MNFEVNTMREFDALLEKLCEQQLSDAEREQLENLLREGSPWRQRYLDYMDLHATLSLVGSDPVSLGKRHAPEAGAHRGSSLSGPSIVQLDGTGAPLHFGLQAAPINGMTPGDVSGVWGWFHAPWIAAIAILCFLAGGAVGIFWTGHSDAPPAVALESTKNSSVTPVAYLTSAHGCDWGDGLQDTWTVGHTVESGSEIALHEGIAEFRLSNDVHISVEGPAMLSITSPESLVLQRGKLTARVPWEVKEFQLLAGDCRVTARDAEFGVSVTNANVEVHSFAGEAQILSAELPGNQSTAPAGIDLVVQEGHAVMLPSIDKTSEKSRRADRNKFATKLSMSGHLPVSEKYISAVQSSRPIGYWRFESIEKGLIENEVKGGQPLKVEGKVALSGDSKNQVLELTSPYSDGYLISRDDLSLLGSDYTIELWMKPSHFHNGVLAAMTLGGPPAKHGMIFELEAAEHSRFRSPGSVRFVHRNPPGNVSGTWCFSNCLYGLRRWQHVVAVQEKESMRIYLDGVLVATKPANPGPQSPDLHLLIGQIGPDDTRRKFVGLLDEIAVYNRALSGKEILNHWEAMDFRSKGPASTPDI